MTYTPKKASEALESVTELRVRYTVNLDVDHKFRPRISFNHTAPVVKQWSGTVDIAVNDPNTKFCAGSKTIFFDNSTQDVQPIKVAIQADIDRDYQPHLTSIILNQVSNK